MSDPTRSYRPSNGTEGDIFYEKWCERCHREQGGRQCRIYAHTLAYQVIDKEYPKEWVEDPDGSNPRCTAFEDPHARRRHNTIKDKRQEGLPL